MCLLRQVDNDNNNEEDDDHLDLCMICMCSSRQVVRLDGGHEKDYYCTLYG